MRLRWTQTLTLFFASICCSLTEKPSNASSPNIIIMLMDDVSYFPFVFVFVWMCPRDCSASSHLQHTSVGAVNEFVKYLFPPLCVYFVFVCVCLCLHVCFTSLLWIYIYARLVNKLSNLSLCYSDGLGGLGGVWSALQRNPQPGCHGSSGHAASKFLHSKPTLFPVWVSDSVKQDWISTFSFAKC